MLSMMVVPHVRELVSGTVQLLPPDMLQEGIDTAVFAGSDTFETVKMHPAPTVLLH